MLSISDGLTISGIALTIIGSLINVFSVLFEKTDDLVERFMLYPGCNGKAIEYQIEHNKKSEFSIVIVLMGSALQISSIVFKSILISKFYFPVILCIGIPTVFLAYYFIFFKKQVNDAKKFANKIADEKLHNN